ncbi:Ankyrin repeat-containing protein [Colletotrichum scovillei]|uniref:Ankyrin repeat-containing protein n=1 Tax=Colletotrichum scovillei TaxID=1209932 RepID=A0A9P7UBE2_9PEZI|nr:Ankyrin repeat-containing protein [Colletotrichum scovillei]KAG7049709.1 Ankyrin repeat-containing protein [Colletotrichum scovillei]KAG7064447.1 Ankyrin repeat-containing protein [Colletotrichum scovillei]
MAEALGLAASVIAVVDVTAKVGSATFKLMKLWNEVKEVPTMLLQKAERIRDLEDFLLDAEDHIQNSPLPQAFWKTNHRLQQHIEKVRRALDEVQQVVDDLQAKSTARKDGFRSKLLSTRVVFRKDELRALDRKLDTALSLFSIAQMQWIMAMSAFRTSMTIEERSVRPAASNAPTVEKKTKRVLASNTPALFYISTPASFLPTFRFGFGDNDNFQLSIQAPSWLTGSVYSFMAQKSYQGWQLNLRAYEVVGHFSEELLDCIGNDDSSGTLQVLSKYNMTPFVKDKFGKSLLHPSRHHDLEPTLLNLFLDNFFDDYLDDPEQVSILLAYGISLSSLQLLLRRNNLISTSFSFLTRLSHFRLVAANCIWEAWEVCIILPEARYLHVHPGPLAYSRNIEGSALFHSFAIGMAGNFSRKTHHPVLDQWAISRQWWNRLLHDCIRLDRPSLHHIDSTLGWSGYKSRRSSPLLAIIGSLIDSDRSNLRKAEQVSKSLVATLSEWVAILSSSDVVLLDYGRQEGYMYKQGLTAVFQRWAPWDWESTGTTRFSLIGITYGSYPKHWMLWWTYEYEDYAGEFWNMIQDKASRVPGAWVEDSWDPDDYEVEELIRREEWENEQPTPLIWSEYRRVRPPA